MLANLLMLLKGTKKIKPCLGLLLSGLFTAQMVSDYQFKPNNTNVDLNLFGAAVAVTFKF